MLTASQGGKHVTPWAYLCARDRVHSSNPPGCFPVTTMAGPSRSTVPVSHRSIACPRCHPRGLCEQEVGVRNRARDVRLAPLPDTLTHTHFSGGSRPGSLAASGERPAAGAPLYRLHSTHTAYFKTVRHDLHPALSVVKSIASIYIIQQAHLLFSQECLSKEAHPREATALTQPHLPSCCAQRCPQHP